MLTHEQKWRKKVNIVQTSLQSSDDILGDVNDWEKYLWNSSVCFKFPRASVFQLWAFMYIRRNIVNSQIIIWKGEALCQRMKTDTPNIWFSFTGNQSPPWSFLEESEELSSVHQRYLATLLWLTTASRQDLFLDT